MDRPNLNMRHRRWLNVVKDYGYEILYHLGKANVAANALSRRLVNTLIRDMCLRITVVTPILKMIRDAQSEAIKEENQKSERVVSQVSTFNIGSRGY